MNGAEREPNCWLRIRGGPSDGKYRAYLAPSAIPVAVKRGKAQYLRVNPPAPEERYDPSSVEESGAAAHRRHRLGDLLGAGPPRDGEGPAALSRLRHTKRRS